jgi:hypothetical protein
VELLIIKKLILNYGIVSLEIIFLILIIKIKYIIYNILIVIFKVILWQVQETEISVFGKNVIIIILWKLKNLKDIIKKFYIQLWITKLKKLLRQVLTAKLNFGLFFLEKKNLINLLILVYELINYNIEFM